MAHPRFVNLTCTEISSYCPVSDTIYGYYPSLGFNAFFVAFFALFAIVHATLGLLHRTYFFAYVLTLGSIAEALGYGGRVMLHHNPYNSIGFEMQISCLIFAPAFVAAAIYITLKHITMTFGAKTSLLPPHLYTWIFISVDAISLMLQAVGGGLAGSAKQNARQRAVGTDLMIAGIVFQAFTLIVFAGLVFDYILRSRRAWDSVHPDAKALLRTTRFRLFVLGVSIAYIGVFTRCIYRIPELTGGWASPLMREQTSFIILEGFMIVIAVLAFAVFHPGFCFPSLAGRTKDKFDTSRRRSSGRRRSNRQPDRRYSPSHDGVSMSMGGSDSQRDYSKDGSAERQ